MNISYTMGLCMVSLGEATGCLTKHIETAQSNASKFLSDFYIIYFHRIKIRQKFICNNLVI